MSIKLHKRISRLRTPVALVIMVVVAAHHSVIQTATAGWHLPSEILVYGIAGPIGAWFLMGWLARSVEAAEKAGDAQAEGAASLARRNTEIEALYNASRLLTGARSLSNIASSLLQLAMRITRAKSGALVFFDSDDAAGQITPAAGAEGSKLREDLLAHVAAGACLTCPESPRCPLSDSVRCMPIVAGRHVLGILRLSEPAWNPGPRQSLDALLSEIAAVWMARQAESRALSAFSKVSQELRSEADIGSVLTRFAELTCDASGAAAARLYRREDSDWVLKASSRSEKLPPLPHSIPDGPDAVWHEKKGRFAYVLVEGECLLALDFAGVRPLNQRDTDLLCALASQGNVLATITQRMSGIMWSERQRTAQELHDGLAQNIAFLNLQIRRLADMLDDDAPEHVRADLRKLSDAALDTYDELRMTIGDLRMHPGDGERPIGFLRRIVEAFARRENIEANIDAPADLVVSEEVLAHLTRIVQEALSNAVRHGAATHVDIVLALEAKGSQLRMSIRDDGKGFDAADTNVAEGHYGFKTMRERAASMAGSVWFDSRPEQGTTVHIRLPGIASQPARDDVELAPRVAE